MADPYAKVKGGRLAFKGGGLATVGKSIDKKKKKKNKKNKEKHELSLDQEASEFLPVDEPSAGGGAEGSASAAAGGEIYTIDAAKRLKYEQLFPVEAKKFRYDPKSQVRSVEEALDDRVKKKADRYCK